MYDIVYNIYIYPVYKRTTGTLLTIFLMINHSCFAARRDWSAELVISSLEDAIHFRPPFTLFDAAVHSPFLAGPGLWNRPYLAFRRDVRSFRASVRPRG